MLGLDLGLLRSSRLVRPIEHSLSAHAPMLRLVVASSRLRRRLLQKFGLMLSVVGLGSLLGLEISLVFRRKSWVCYGPLKLDRRPGMLERTVEKALLE